jgi:hypothetical protein
MNSSRAVLPTQFQSFIHLSRYSRWLHEENRRESWTETVSRYFDFFESHLKENTKFSLTKALRAELESAILNLEVMPSMRCLMTAGEALTKSNIAGYNCAYTTVNRVRAFDEILYVLMCLDPNTEVVTLNGNKRICNIDPNADMLLTYNEKTQDYEYEQPIEVIEVRTGSQEPMVKLTFDDGTILVCTSDHKILTKNRGWIEAQHLSEVDDLEIGNSIHNTIPVPFINNLGNNDESLYNRKYDKS